jgi:hypothetical protein
VVREFSPHRFDLDVGYTGIIQHDLGGLSAGVTAQDTDLREFLEGGLGLETRPERE